MDPSNLSSLGDPTHLEWLEDIELPQPPTADRGSQGGVDLRLLAVTALGALLVLYTLKSPADLRVE